MFSVRLFLCYTFHPTVNTNVSRFIAFAICVPLKVELQIAQLIFVLLETPAKIVKPFKAQKVKESHEAEFTVSLDKSKQQVTWYKNGEEITASETFQVCFSFCLINVFFFWNLKFTLIYVLPSIKFCCSVLWVFLQVSSTNLTRKCWNPDRMRVVPCLLSLLVHVASTCCLMHLYEGGTISLASLILGR